MRLDKRGLTATELLIGLTIIGILAACAAPQFARFLMAHRLNGAAKVVWGDFHRARMIAIKENISIELELTSVVSYDIRRRGTSQVIFSRNLAVAYPQVTIRMNPNTLTFGGTGTAGGSRTVVITGPAGVKTFTVITSGRIGGFS
jgi:prepilin-type N-terminal cleavage/methylation domain-containing protein